MKFIPHGAAREVTGSCHELQIETASGTKHILLDCGLFQGKRSEAAEKNATFTFDPEKVIDAVILSHAHMDHAGRIPLLWRRGYRGPVFSTYATRDLAEVMLMDGGYIQEKDEEFFRKHLAESMLASDGPLYTMKDATECIELFIGQNYNEWFIVCDGVRAQFLEAGHIVGAALVVLEVTEHGKTTRVGFSGDLGRSMLPIIRDPSPMPDVDVLICESTYGDRKHEDIGSAKEHLKEAIVRTAHRGGKVLIPAFSLERTQELLYDLHLLWDAKEIPPVPIYVDSPLASKVTEVFMKHPECYDQTMFEKFLSKAHNPFQFSLVHISETADDSKALNGLPGPVIIMAGSGMCEAGRIRHHLKNSIEDARNCIVAVGYMAEHTLGRKIMDPATSQVKIFDRLYAKRAEMVSIAAYSGHADMADLDSFIQHPKGLQTLVLVHGEPEQMDALAGRMAASRPGMRIEKPEREAVVEI
ncbi:MAG: MBL fold metallo-hydrolase [Candidatus Peregrinibacteria bacterium]